MNSQIALIAVVSLVCAVQLATSSPLSDHDTASMSRSKPTPTPFLKTPYSVSSPRPDAPKVSSVSIPKSKEVDSAIHTLKTKTGEPVDANNADADLDGANTFFIGMPYGGFYGGFPGFGYPGFGMGGVYGR